MRAVLAALAVNLGIAVTKFIAFLVSGSASMLAESVHSVADTFNQVLLLIGNARSDRSATEEHPFGYGRESYFYGFVVAVLLFGVGGVFSAYDGARKIIHPEPVHDPAIAFIVLGISVVLESLSLRTALQEVNKVRPVRTFASLTRFIRRTKAPELVVVVLEDSAALLGLLFAFTGVLLSVLTGNGAWDGAGSVAIGVLLVCAAFVVARETKSLLIGESASEEMNGRIVSAVEEGPEDFRVIHLRSVHLSRDALLVTAKISVSPSASAESLAAGIDEAERRIRSAVPVARMIYLEPDIYHPGRFDRNDPSIRAARRKPPRPPSRRRTSASASAPGPPPSAPSAPPAAPGTPAPQEPPDSSAPSANG
jgi:cation diffusion facilitator family transporter